MGMSVGGGRRGGGFSDINVTPLVDVMLVLLIVFMITAPLLTTTLKVDLPNVQAKETTVEDSKLVLSVSKEGRIFLSEVDVTDSVEKTLQGNERIQREKELYIRADKDAKYGAVAKAIAAARKAGVKSLNLLVQPEIDTAAGESTSPVTPVPEVPTGKPATKPAPAPPKGKK
ncbi:MAG: biopolymer transporter ExbD [Polyangiaceae bacterium]